MDAAREQPNTGNVLNERGVTVSSSHIVSQGSSYPIHAVTSASSRKEPQPRLQAGGFIAMGLVLGILALLILPEPLTEEAARIELAHPRLVDAIPLNSLAVGIPGLLLVIVGIGLLVRKRATYTVVLHAPAGIKQVFTDRDEQWVAKVVESVNEAINAREPGASGTAPSPGQG